MKKYIIYIIIPSLLVLSFFFGYSLNKPKQELRKTNLTQYGNELLCDNKEKPFCYDLSNIGTETLCLENTCIDYIKDYDIK